jgi:hypothetical protein
MNVVRMGLVLVAVLMIAAELSAQTLNVSQINNNGNGTLTVGGSFTPAAGETVESVQIFVVPEGGGTAYVATATLNPDGTFTTNISVATGGYKVYVVANTRPNDGTGVKQFISPVSSIAVTGGNNPKPPTPGTVTHDDGKPKVIPGTNPKQIESSGTVTVDPNRATDKDSIEITIVPNAPSSANTTTPPILNGGRPSKAGGTFTGTATVSGEGPYTVLIRITITVRGVTYYIYAKPMSIR